MMRRSMNSRQCGVLFLMSVCIIGYAFADDEDITSLNAHLARSEDYMGLDGEFSILPLSCSTCALVGTSGHLLYHEYGSEIDENHTCIFRLGFSPVRGMERFVGSRTTVRVVNSFSFFPFLKRPWKLKSGFFNSGSWILYNRRPGDITWFYKPMLSGILKKYDTNFLWFTKRAEFEMYSVLKKKAPRKDKNMKMSALWFALKVVKDAGCASLNVYGIPDYLICKRLMDVTVPSLYWENRSQPVCRNGMDASFTLNKSTTVEANVPTIPERKAMVDWVSHHIGDVNFYAPHWPD